MPLEVENISKRYINTIALDHVSFSLENGVYGILGANGAGKTTLVNIIIGILSQTEGVVRYNGKDIRSLGCDYLTNIGYMPQNCSFYPNFTVREFLQYMCSVKGISHKTAVDRIERVLEAVNMKDDSQKRICELSGGMRQRTGIAQALLNDPEILVLDEPTAGLDPAERIRFRNIISSIAGNRIVIITTHIVSDIEYIANQVMIFDKGKLKKTGAISTLCSDIAGKVWVNTVKEKEALAISHKYLVSAMRREDNDVLIRVINEKAPDEDGFKTVTPDLDDVFLDIYSKERSSR